MATVTQLEQLEKRLETEFKAIYAETKRLDGAAGAKAKERWHINDLKTAREYTFRAPTIRHELPGELGINEQVIKADYNPDFKTQDQAWTARDGENVEWLRTHGEPQSYDECVAVGDTESCVALYLEARDMIVSPEHVAEEQRTQDANVWTVIVEQCAAGEATLWQCDLYTPSVRFADDGKFVRFNQLAYSDELGLYDTTEISVNA